MRLQESRRYISYLLRIYVINKNVFGVKIINSIEFESTGVWYKAVVLKSIINYGVDGTLEVVNSEKKDNI